jgi:hypothetical protein
MRLRGESRAHSVTMAALAGLRLDMALGVLPGHLMFIHGLFNVEFPFSRMNFDSFIPVNYCLSNYVIDRHLMSLDLGLDYSP